MIQNGANIESGLVRGTLAAIGALIEVDEVDANLWKKQGEVSLHAAVGRRKTHMLDFFDRDRTILKHVWSKSWNSNIAAAFGECDCDIVERLFACAADAQKPDKE